MKNIDEMLCRVWLVFGIAVFVVSILIPELDSCVGSTERTVLMEILSEKTEPGRKYMYDTGESMIAGLSYNAESEDCEYDIYVNRPGFSFGWFFRHGGNLPRGDEYVKKIVVEGSDDYALVSANEPRVCRIEVDDGMVIQTYLIDPEQPFVMVLPGSTAGCTLYNENDEVVSVHTMKGQSKKLPCNNRGIVWIIQLIVQSWSGSMSSYGVRVMDSGRGVPFISASMKSNSALKSSQPCL